jgi:hypothetical protein
MAMMTGKERISRILQRKPVDRIGLFEHFWGDTMKKWQGQGHLHLANRCACLAGDGAACAPVVQ